MIGSHFIEIPVYRLSKEKYNTERESYIQNILFPVDQPKQADLNRKFYENSPEKLEQQKL